MKTFYEILKIKNDASDIEIEEAYTKLEKKFQNNKTELKNIQIARQILLNKEARANYDEKLKQIEANDIFSKIKSNTDDYNDKLSEKEIYNDKEHKNEEVINDIDSKKYKKTTNVTQNPQKKKKLEEIQADLDKRKKIEEKNKIKEEKRIKKLKEKQKKYQQQKYQEAYNNYLRSLGYKVKTPWTFDRIKRLFITIIVIILTFFIMWQIPFIKKPLLDLYENNKVVNILVNIVISIINAVWDGIKGMIKGGE